MNDTNDMAAIADRIVDVRRRIAAAAARAGRSPEDITLVAVTKTHPIEAILAAAGAGITRIGESRVQEAKEKIGLLAAHASKPKLQWHLVGHLQTNKARQAVELFDIIHSVDSLGLAREIDRRAYTKDKLMPILVEVNTSREKSKYGIDPDDALGIVTAIAELKNVRIQGLMTIGALSAATAGDVAHTRRCFRKLKELRDFVTEQKIPNVDMAYLSMGMSGDFELAVEEGANLVRIGTAVFGKRRRGVTSFSLQNTNSETEGKS